MNFKKINLIKFNIIRTFLFILIFSSSQLFAAEISVPNTFSSGEVISANKMNENFSALETGLNHRLDVYTPDNTLLGHLIDIKDDGTNTSSIVIYNDSIGKFMTINGNGRPNQQGSGSLGVLLFESTDCSGQPYIVRSTQAHYFVHAILETTTPNYTFSYYVAKSSQVYFEQKTIKSTSEWVYPNRICYQDLNMLNTAVVPVESINLTLFDNSPYFPLKFK